MNKLSGRLRVQLLSPVAQVPKRQSMHAAGYDLHSAVKMTIPAHGKGVVPTALSIQVPAGTYGRIAPRSGLAVKSFIDVGAGVIDADYRGEVKVVLFNHSRHKFRVDVGSRIAQLILEVIRTPDVTLVNKLSATLRGRKGFGSTDKK